VGRSGSLNSFIHEQRHPLEESAIVKARMGNDDFIESHRTFELTRRRESKHLPLRQASYETRSRRSRPTICSAELPLASRRQRFEFVHVNNYQLISIAIQVAIAFFVWAREPSGDNDFRRLIAFETHS